MSFQTYTTTASESYPSLFDLTGFNYYSTVAKLTYLSLLNLPILIYAIAFFTRPRIAHSPVEKRPAMAWLSSGSSNVGLIKNLASNGLITSDRVKNAMLAVRPPSYQLPLA